MRNYFPKRPSGASLHTLSKLNVVPVGFVNPYFEAVYCFICGRQRVAVARYRMICLVLTLKASPYLFKLPSTRSNSTAAIFLSNYHSFYAHITSNECHVWSYLYGLSRPASSAQKAQKYKMKKNPTHSGTRTYNLAISSQML